MTDQAAKVTATDVARLAGVSQSAVSRVFTPGASASPKTAAKVRAAAEQLGYRPDPLARAMITGRTRIIGLVVAYLENQFYPLALERLSRALQERGERQRAGACLRRRCAAVVLAALLLVLAEGTFRLVLAVCAVSVEVLAAEAA